MRKNLRKIFSLNPIENDDNFFGVYHGNNSSKKKLNFLLKKPLNLEINNVNPFTGASYKLDYTLEKYGKRHNFLPKIPKINLKFNQEQLPNIITNVSTSQNSFIYHKPIEDEKSKLRPKIKPISRKLTINNIIFTEDIAKKNNLSKSSSKSKLNIIYLEKKKNVNDSNKNIINKIYEKEMNQFKLYSKNMNEMIANQMVLEFFRRTKELRKLKPDDLMVNYIQSNDKKNNYNYNYYNRRISTTDTNNNEINENINQKDTHNLIIHNVFFEWIISNVIQKYINEINILNKNTSIKNIRNLLMNEVRSLSQLFFYKKNEKDIPRNMRIVRNIFAKYKKNNGNLSENRIKNIDNDLQMDIKKEEIKQKIMEKIIEKVVITKEQKNINNKNKLNKIKNNKSADVLNMQNNFGLN